MVNFILSDLSSNITLDLCGNVYSEAIPDVASDVDAVAAFFVSTSDIKSIFKYATNDADVNDLASADMKFYVNTELWPQHSACDAYMLDGGAWDSALTNLNPSQAVSNFKIVGTSAIAVSDTDGNVFANNKTLVAHDFLRSMAQDLFGAHQGVGLFHNNVELLKELRVLTGNASAGNSWYDINAKLAAVGTDGTASGIVTGTDSYGNYMTNVTTDETNICRVLFDQMFHSDASRFENIEPQTLPQSLPFQDGDSIGFILTIHPNADQHLLTGVSTVNSRRYLIRLILENSVSTTDGGDGSSTFYNQAIATDEV